MQRVLILTRRSPRCWRPAATTRPRARSAVPTPRSSPRTRLQPTGTTVIVYDDFHKAGGYTLADYNTKWSTLTLGEMAVEDTRHFDTTRSRSPHAVSGPGRFQCLRSPKYTALSNRRSRPEIAPSPARSRSRPKHPTILGHVFTAPTSSRARRTAARVLQASRPPPRVT